MLESRAVIEVDQVARVGYFQNVATAEGLQVKHLLFTVDKDHLKTLKISPVLSGPLIRTERVFA